MAGALPQVSVVLPVYDEAECIGRVITEIDGVLRQLDREYEIVAVDDGSRDDTRQVLVGLRQSFPMLRVIALTPHAGQSAAFEAGFQAAGGGLIVTMDADGQNDPGWPRTTVVSASAWGGAIRGASASAAASAMACVTGCWANRLSIRGVRSRPFALRAYGDCRCSPGCIASWAVCWPCAGPRLRRFPSTTAHVRKAAASTRISVGCASRFPTSWPCAG